MFDVIENLKKIKELFIAKDFWAVADLALDTAKKVKSLWEQLADSGLFKAENPAELEAAMADLEALTVVKFGAVEGDKDPKVIDPATVIALVSLVLDLIKKWRDNRNK